MGYAVDRTGSISITGGSRDLPDGDWAVGGWLNVTDYDGDQACDVLAHVAGSPKLSWRYYESAYSVSELRLHHEITVTDDGAVTRSFVTYGHLALTAGWRHFVLQQSGGMLRLFYNSQADPLNDLSCDDAVSFGADALRFGSAAKASFAEWAKWDRALSAAEILSLSYGYSPLFFGTNLAWYLPLDGAFYERVVPLTVTGSNAAVPSYSPHPMQQRPGRIWTALHLPLSPAAAAIRSQPRGVTMAQRAQELTITYEAIDLTTSRGKTGDAANHTLRWVKDGAVAAPTNGPAEVDATNCPGQYRVTITATEADCAFGTLAGVSSTANVVLQAVRMGFVAAGAAGGDVNVTQIDGSALAAQIAKLVYSKGVRTGAVEDYSPTATTFLTTLPVDQTNHYQDQVLFFTSGNDDQEYGVVLSSATEGSLTRITLVSALTAAPESGSGLAVLGCNPAA